MESHDDLLDALLTPLAVMKGAISIVLKHGHRLEPSERAKWLELAIAQSDQLNALMMEMDPARARDEITLPESFDAVAIEEGVAVSPKTPVR